MFQSKRLCAYRAESQTLSAGVCSKVEVYLQVPSKEERQLMLRRPELPDGFQGRGFKGSMREGAAECVISLCTVLGLVGMKVKFRASSTFCFQPVQDLCSCGQQFLSGGGLLPVETTQKCVSGLHPYLSGNWEFGVSMWWIFSLNSYQLPCPTAVLYFCIFMFPSH